jgi:transposase
MTRPYSIAFKQKMVERLIGKDAVSAIQLARETGVRQQSLSRWLQEASTLPFMATPKAEDEQWSVEQKARLLADASGLSGQELTAYLEAQGVKFADFERWRVALQDARHGSTSAARRIRQLERELARKEKALAEAAALLVLKKRVRSLFTDEDSDTEEPSER